MTTNETHAGGPRGTDSPLDAHAAPGRRWFGLSAALLTAGTVLTITRWAGLAWTVQGVMRRSPTQEATGLTAFVVAGASAMAAEYAAGALGERGARAVAGELRSRLVGALLPAADRSAETGPAEAALAVVDLVDDVADHHARAVPLRWSAPLSTLAVLAVTAALHWPAAIVLVLTTALVPLNMRLAGLVAQHGADRQLAATRQLNAIVLDSFRGMRTLRELGAAGRRSHTVAAASERLGKATMSVLRRAFLSGMVMDVVITFSIAVNATYIGLSLLGYVHVPHAPELTLFTGLSVLLVCPMYFAPTRARAAAFHQRERAATAAGAIDGIVAHAPARSSTHAPTHALTRTHARTPAPPAPVPTPVLRAAGPRLTEPVGVSLDGVRHRYGGADRDTVSADADFAPGAWTAITGASGAGKTTLLSLIAGMRRPAAGHVRWRTPTASRPPAPGECAWVGQQTVLLDATVRDNIRLGRVDATEQQIARAAAAAGLTAVLERLPAGLNTRLGEGGWGISTGEARRIAIARAFLRGAGLWLLDEPTAHLDADTEREVVAALRRAAEGRTVIVATHSFALAAEADTVFTIDDGVLGAAPAVTAR